MKNIKITTPENIDVEYTLADIGSRTAAAIIDSLIQGLFILGLLIALGLLEYFSPTFWQKYQGWIAGIAILLYGIITYGYFIAMELSSNGQTVGKKILKLRAIRSNGQPITLRHSAIRNLFRVFIDVLGVGTVMIFFTKEHRRLGDFAASTIVVSEQVKTRPVTLEDLQRTNENFDYYISKEEQELLRAYFERKAEISDNSRLREELKKHFTKKFEDLGNVSQWQEFIDKI